MDYDLQTLTTSECVKEGWGSYVHPTWCGQRWPWVESPPLILHHFANECDIGGLLQLCHLCICTLRGARFAIRVAWQLYITVLQRSIYTVVTYCTISAVFTRIFVDAMFKRFASCAIYHPSFCTLASGNLENPDLARWRLWTHYHIILHRHQVITWDIHTTVLW